MLAGAGVAEGVRVLPVEVEVVRRRLGRRRHHVPARAAARDQVERGELAGDVVGLLVGGRGGGDEAEVLGQRRERREQRHRLEARDLGVAALDAAAEGDGEAVGEEVGVEEPALGGLGELAVELEAGGAVGRGIRVAPGGDMLAAAGKEGAELDLSGHAFDPWMMKVAAIRSRSESLPASRRRRRPAVQAIGRGPCAATCSTSWSTARAMRSRSAGAVGSPSVKSRSRSIDAGRQRRRLEEAEERPELVLDHQGMPVSAAGRGQQHRLADEIGRRDKVEQVLEEPGVAALVDRARDHERVGADDLFKRLPRDRRQIVDLGRTAERRGKLADIEDDATTTQAAGRLPDDSFHERPCLRRATEVAGDADDPRGHYCSPEVASSCIEPVPLFGRDGVSGLGVLAAGPAPAAVDRHRHVARDR